MQSVGPTLGASPCGRLRAVCAGCSSVRWSSWRSGRWRCPKKSTEKSRLFLERQLEGKALESAQKAKSSGRSCKPFQNYLFSVASVKTWTCPFSVDSRSHTVSRHVALHHIHTSTTKRCILLLRLTHPIDSNRPSPIRRSHQTMTGPNQQFPALQSWTRAFWNTRFLYKQGFVHFHLCFRECRSFAETSTFPAWPGKRFLLCV